MQTYTKEELKVIIDKHNLWRQNNVLGERANLSYANLRNADLREADLSYADLSNANLSYADLRKADLRKANLSYANLSYAKLSYANLSGADLSNANLSYADLRCLGNKSEVKTLQIEKWDIGYTHDTLQIGCQTHLISKWRKWNTPTETTRVIYSPSFGGGLTFEESFSADDPRLVELYNKGASFHEAQDVFPTLYPSAWSNLRHKDVPKGSWWKINEYDGAESVDVITSLDDSGFKQA